MRVSHKQTVAGEVGYSRRILDQLQQAHLWWQVHREMHRQEQAERQRQRQLQRERKAKERSERDEAIRRMTTEARAARTTAITTLREQGLTLAEIGERFGICRERVRQILKKGDQ